MLDRERAERALGKDIAGIFLVHAECLPPGDVRDLLPLIEVHLDAAHTVRCSMHTAVDVFLASRIAAACRDLIGRYPDLDTAGREAVVGAVRYFLLARDAANDLSPEGGFEDDARVVNYVIDLIGAGVDPVKVE